MYIRMRIEHARQDWRLQEAGTEALVRNQKRFHFGTQRGIGGAGFVEEPGPLLRGKLHGLVQQILDALPGGADHGDAVRLIWR